MSHKLRSSLLITAAALTALLLLPYGALAAPAAPYHSHSMSRILGLQGIHKSARAATLCGTVAVPVLCEYAYIYNTSNETVPLEGDVTFNNAGTLSTGITHAALSPTITVAIPGTYRVTFYVMGMEASQLTLMVNGSPVPATTYELGGSEAPNIGEALITIPAAGTIALRNHSSFGSVDIHTRIGGTQTNVDASIILQQL